MPTVGLIENFLNGELKPYPAADEAACYKVWHERGLGALPPVLSALQGGLCADRLPWVFIAGYQAAIRHVFPAVPREGWAAYAATEDKTDPIAHPGARLAASGKGFALDGHKSWVAQSKHVDHLLVTVNSPIGEGAQCVLLSSQQQGVHLSHRENPGFLGAMSQGYAQFEAVEIAAENVFDNDQVREFGRREPRYVMLAGAGYLLAHLRDADLVLQQDLIGLILALAAACDSGAVMHKTLAGLDRALQSAIARFSEAADGAALPQWEADRRLLSMYSARIQERAAR